MTAAASNSLACVVVAIDDETLRLRCGQALRGVVSRLLIVGRDSMPVDLPTAVLLTDRDAADDFAERPTWSRVAIGPAARFGDQFDAVLPADCGDDELQRTIALASKLSNLRSLLRDRESATNRWARLATTDSLTGLPNRLAWDDALPHMVRSATVARSPLCLAILDLDEFKQVNDRHGHAVGDAVLQTVAAGLRSAVRRGDFCARLGGDEFGLLLPDLAIEQAASVLERIRASILATPAGHGLPQVTGSIGYALGAGDEQSAELYQAADRALLEAKRSGRNRLAWAARP